MTALEDIYQAIAVCGIGIMVTITLTTICICIWLSRIAVALDVRANITNQSE
jgi:hypothetical protein